MIDKELYRETFARLCASDEAKKEVFLKMEKQKKLRFPKILRGAAIAAVMTMALAVTAGAANVATDGMLLNGMLFHILSFDNNHMELEDDQGNRLSVTAVGGDLVREEDGRVYVAVDGEDVDITGPLLEDGSYHFEYEVNTAVEGGSVKSKVVAVDVTGVPGDLTVTQRGVDDDENTVIYSVAGESLENAGDEENFITVSGSYVAEDGTVKDIDIESGPSSSSDAEE